MEDILALLKEEAKKSPNYQEWNPNIDEYACIKDENNESCFLVSTIRYQLFRGRYFSFYHTVYSAETLFDGQSEMVFEH